MCSMSVLCPLCAQTSFTSIDALRNSLIKAANGPLACPICSELFLGLDKLTIHLFSHTNLMSHNATKTTTKVEDVPTISNEIQNATKSSSELHIQKQTKNGDTSLKKLTEDNSILEKKAKRNKQIRTSTVQIGKESQRDAVTTLSTLNQNQSISIIELSQPSTCDICEFTFRNDQLRDMHFRLVHQNSPKMTMTMPMSSMLPTQNGPPIISIPNPSNEPEFKCHLCAKTFKMKGSLRVHLKVVHMIGINYVNNSSKLGICDRIRYKEVKNLQNMKTTAIKGTLPLAQQIVVPVQNCQQPNLPNSNSTDHQQLETITLLAAQQIPTTQKTNAFSDLTTTTVANNSILGSNVLLVFTPKNDELNKEMFNKSTSDNPKIWECDVCSKSFTTKYFLKKHKRLHTGEMPYSCEICGRTFTFQQSYHKHLLYHSDEKPHICAICGRAFKELSTLHNHERIHSGEKPFKCEICGKCFRQRVSFLVHTRIHTGVMPYKCEQCEKNFRYKVSLRTHKCIPSAPQSEAATINSQELSSPTTTAPQVTEGSNDLTENFIKAFLESTNASSSSLPNESQNSPASLEIAAITDSTCLEPEKIFPKSVEALLSKTIDDIVVESCNKMGIGNTENAIGNLKTHLTPSPLSSNAFGIQNFSDGSSSPLQKLQNMRLQSPKFDVSEELAQFPQMIFNNNRNDAH